MKDQAPSTHRAEVVAVQLEPLPDTDALSLVRISGFQVVVRTEDWAGKALAVHIQPDQVVDTARPEFSWLTPNVHNTSLHRTHTRKFKGHYSHGFLIDAPADAKLGEDLAGPLGVMRYVPPSEGRPEFNLPGPAPQGLPRPVYDLESWRKYHHDVFTLGEPIVITEKVNGENARFTVQDGVLFVGSRTEWKVEHPNNQWWRALRYATNLERFLRDFPGLTAYGEVYGHVGGYQYGRGGQIAISLFDLLDANGQWISYHKAKAMTRPYELPWVMEVYSGGHKAPLIEELAEGDTLMVPKGDPSAHIREGIVIRSQSERAHPVTGRAVLKLVSNSFSER